MTHSSIISAITEEWHKRGWNRAIVCASAVAGTILLTAGIVAQAPQPPQTGPDDAEDSTRRRQSRRHHD